MQITSPTPSARGGSSPPAGNAGAPDACGSGFADLLQGATPEMPTPAERSAAASREARHRAPARPAPARPAERPPADSSAAAEARDAEDGVAAPADDASDRQMLDWIAAMQAPPAAPQDDAGASLVPGEGSATDAAALARPGAPGQAPRRAGSVAAEAEHTSALRAAGGRERTGLAAGAAPPAGADDTAVAAEGAAGGHFAEGLRAAIDAAAGGPRAHAGSDAGPMAAVAGTHGPHGPTAASAADATPAAVAVPLPTPLDDPQFPRAFGVQVSVLARDGVQRAELHLNPAEMGPVAVQIVMDGTQARIEFGANAAGTRQLIESSLPDLAAALREAGLTLSGGGVSQHPSGRDAGEHGTPGSPREGTPAEGETARAPARRVVRAGGVDTYA